MNFTLDGINFLALPVFFATDLTLGIPMHTCRFFGGENETISSQVDELITTNPPNNEPATLSA